ncbi:hypothetical protein FRB93_012419 [Tulasnella sp. JGI-2019a]|nr:hypothetical protein FRB93_012419 [Tulasnella sp. JGI-2019a]
MVTSGKKHVSLVAFRVQLNLQLTTTSKFLNPTTSSVMDIESTILGALDDLSSTRSSLSRRSRALDNLERLLAELCLCQDKTQLDNFLELQDGFECNISSRIATSLVICLPALQQLSLSTQIQDSKEAAEAVTLTRLTQQALSILQGVALIHADSKAFLGRKSSIHLLLDILSISRHASSSSMSLSAETGPANETTGATTTPPVPAPCAGSPTLAAAVLDTLLCILVDCPPSLRVFEEASGVEGVVKTLKKVGIAREVRMKCLEFLYFYLLPEDGSTPGAGRCASSPMRSPPPDSDLFKGSPSRSVPASPVHKQFPVVQLMAIDVTRMRPPTLGSADRRETSSGDNSTQTPQTSPRGKGLKLTLAPTSPGKKSATLQMLQKDIDFVPVSPKKVQVAGLGVGTPGKLRLPSSKPTSGTTARPSGQEVGGTKLVFPSFTPPTPARKRTQLTKSVDLKEEEVPARKDSTASSPAKRHPRITKGDGSTKSHTRNNSILSETTNMSSSRPSTPASPTKTSKYLSSGSNWPSDYPYGQQQKPRIRSTEEKKELLGTWLGNVDALVDGVQKAGVWGLA